MIFHTHKRERQLVVLYHLQGYDYQELSQLFDIKPGTLRVIICRALKQLGLILKNMGYEHHQ
jgi:RNA polymerase sigma factor (sigma-70 family)